MGNDIVGNLEIIAGQDGSSYVLRAGNPIARFNSVAQAEAFVLTTLSEEQGFCRELQLEIPFE